MKKDINDFNHSIDEFLEGITHKKSSSIVEITEDDEIRSKVLKACPFCGGNPRINFGKSLTRINHEGLAQSFDSYIVECTECGVQTCFYKEASDAMDAWNKRVG